jgi:hypothetical protein
MTDVDGTTPTVGEEFGVAVMGSVAGVATSEIDLFALAESVVVGATLTVGEEFGVPTTVPVPGVATGLTEMLANGETFADEDFPTEAVFAMSAISPALIALSCWIWGSGRNLLIV